MLLDALTKLYGEMARPLLSYALGFTGEIHSAEDIVSETFVRATEHCIVRNALPARAWFYKVARNVALDRFKRKGLSGGCELPEIIDESDETNPEAAALREEDVRELMRAVDKLPELYRTVLVLREYEGFSYAEIAGITGVSLDNVKVLLYRAKRKLRDIYRREKDYGQ